MALYLVTGGAGFIGSHLCDGLLAAGQQVRVVDDLSTGQRANLDPRCELLVGDVADPALLQRALAGAIAETAIARPATAYGADKYGSELHARVGFGVHGVPSLGCRFFNVYGPNEYHKGKMISVVKVKYDEVAAGGPARLFRSDQPGLADGAQSRDFIWVGDVVDVMLWLMETPSASGLFNLGTGRARTYLDLAHAVSDAAGSARDVTFVDMPDSLKGQYQSFTQAPMDRLRAAGYTGQFTPLEEGIRRYVQERLAAEDRYV